MPRVSNRREAQVWWIPLPALLTATLAEPVSYNHGDSIESDVWFSHLSPPNPRHRQHPRRHVCEKMGLEMGCGVGSGAGTPSNLPCPSNK